MNQIFRILQINALSHLMCVRSNSIVLVCGSTGAGKSDLGVQIAKAFDGEVISADSMQIYQGLDIVTNKVTTEEMDGIPHHMMSFCDPKVVNYNVHEFRAASLELISDIRRRNKLPVIVGGTSYYVESILYENYLINTTQELSDETKEMLETASNHELYELLCRIDARSAQQVHRNNKQRVKRALEIFFSTGKRKSEHLADQKSKSFDGQNRLGSLHFKNSLLLNLDSDTAVLDDRLDKRVNKMVKKGLRKELENFYSNYKESLEGFGIGQSIGLKEFIPYLKLSEQERISSEGSMLFEKCCELLKVHTRQYCRRQRKWLEYRILSRAKTREVPEFVRLDTSANFYDLVVPFALKCVENFLSGKKVTSEEDISLPHPALMKLPDKEHLLWLDDKNYEMNSNKIYFCERCHIDLQGQKTWESHIKGRKHLAMKEQKKEIETKKNEIDMINRRSV